jgi:transcription antitermination factor NusA-like protein
LEALVAKMQNEREKDLIIESRFHRQLIGPKGENIQKIRDEFTTVQISFPDLGSKSDIVKLRGPLSDVDKCSRVLNKMYKDMLDANYQVKVPIFKQFHKFVIGKGGATIKKIRQETDTRVDLPESGNESDVITITGKKENVEKAEKKITLIQTEMANVVAVDVMIPCKIHNTMIGAGGKLIRSISDDCGGVAIKFPPSDSNSDKVTIRGPKDDVEKAKKMLVELSNERQLNSMSAEIRAKPEHHKFLIGRQGANIQTVRDKTGARIIFPNEKDKDREVITILGSKESVAAAKLELEARIKDLDQVNHKFKIL